MSLVDVRCFSCRESIGKSPHHFDQKVLYCFDCAEKKEVVE